MMYGFNGFNDFDGDRLGACFGNGFMHGGGYGMFPFLHLGIGILLLALAGLAAFFILRRPGFVRTNAAAEALAIRLANGEIDEAEYLQKKKLLK